MARLSPAPEQQSEVAGALGADDWADLEFEALGTWVLLAVRGGGPGLLIDARQRIAELDHRWNPDVPGSMIAALNAAAGRPVPVDDDTYALVERVRHEGVVLDPVLTRITVPEGQPLGLEGLAWGFAADLVAEGLVEAGAGGAVVDIGGVLRLDGATHEDSAWRAEVHDSDGRLMTTVGLAEGGMATWGQVTVLAPEATHAAELAMGADAAQIEAAGLPALLVGDHGEVTRLGDFARFEHP
jgi:ApbE family